MNSGLGEMDYRRAGLERLRESWLLLEREHFAGAVYLAGRGVESMLRAVIWKHDPEIASGKKSLDTGHNLRDMLTLVADLGVLAEYEHRAELAANIQYAGRLWFNNMRFMPTEKLKTWWWKLGETGPRHTLKKAVFDYYDACSAIVKRCEALCKK
jgi:hypothetical protein